ncbi:cytochrome-c peroxidase [Lunatimonas salinarum]|uniref:cytochrome-c peroxidase n=1 Tax=Lunatimonas salinarum TaxID=1774590 RepID=UPI001ADF898D|nr:cytochrome c peroxidase [Lunatimonas salinarum]
MSPFSRNIIRLALIVAGAGSFILLPAFRTTYTATPLRLDHPSYFGSRYTIPADNPTTVEGVELGRMLFYEPLLSSNNNRSCASCHQQANAFADPSPKSVGTNGKTTQRNAMSLANLLWVNNLFWDGRVNGLEKQALFPLTHPDEMGQSLEMSVRKLSTVPTYPIAFERAFGSREISPDGILKALAQFQRTLISAGSPYDAYLNGNYRLSPQEQRGMELFMTMPQPDRAIRGANCAHCHGTPKMFKELFHDNGLAPTPDDPGRISVTGDALDKGRFRVPTLRNIALTAPYMHDGRFATLDEVLDHYSESIQPNDQVSPFIREVGNDPGRLGLKLHDQEKKDIIAFLHLLTDSLFITNPSFSNPHTP